MRRKFLRSRALLPRFSMSDELGAALEALRALCPAEQALYALCLAVRQKPNYQLWCSLKADRAPCLKTFSRCCQYLQSYVTGSGSPKGFAARKEELEDLFDLADPDGSMGDLFALDAVQTLVQAYEALSDCNAEAAGAAAQLSLGGVIRAVSSGAESAEDPASHPAVADEFEFLSELRERVLGPCKNTDLHSKGWREQVKNALEFATADGVSNIGIEPADDDEA
jgi:uncharacterized protein YjaG (DUF416 family)